MSISFMRERSGYVELRLPSPVKKAIQLLEEAGYEAYCVGGTIRDFFLQKEPKDYDLATNATPKEMEIIFSAFHCIRTGLRHDTVTVHIEECFLEITTYHCGASSIYEDLGYRDLTINSIAYFPSVGFIDPFSGIIDIQNKILRFTSDASKRIQEDPLRMMRVIRFSSQLGFSIKEDDYQQIYQFSSLLSNVSKERIRDELTKLLMYDTNGIEKLYETGLLKRIDSSLNELFSCEQNNPYHYTDVGHHTLDALKHLDLMLDSEEIKLSEWEEKTIRYALLLHDMGKLETKTTDEKGIDHFYHHPQSSVSMARAFLSLYRFSKAEIKHILTLIEYHDYHLSQNQKGLRKILLKHHLYPEIMRSLLIVKLCDVAAHTHSDEMIQKIYNFNKLYTKITNTRPYKISDLSINGHEILAICPSLDPVKIPLIQQECLNLVFYAPNKNTKETLTKFIEKNKGRFLHM